MDPPYRHYYGPPPPHEMDRRYSQNHGPPPPHEMDRYYSQNHGPPPPHEMDRYYSQNHGPPPPHEMDRYYSQNHGPPPPHEMDRYYSQNHGPPPPHEMDRYYSQNHGPPPPHEMDRRYSQNHGPPPSFGPDYGYPPPPEMDPPFEPDYDPPPPQEMDPPYRQDYGPPPPRVMDQPYRQDYGPPPPQEMDPPYRQDYGPPPPQEMDQPYRQEYGPPPPREMDRPYRQDYDPPPPQEMDQPYRQDYGPPPLQEMDQPYRQDYGPPPQEMDQPYRQDYGSPPPQEMDQPHQHMQSPLQKNSHYYHSADRYNGMETSGSSGGGKELPPNSMEAALKEVHVRLPRLVVIPSNAPAKQMYAEGGLPNLGQTCYLSAVMQCIYHSPVLANYLFPSAPLEDVVEKGPARGQVVKAAADLLAEMDRGQAKMGTLAFFKGVCGRMDEKYAGANHREAYGLLSSLLQWLHNDLATGGPECACTKNLPKSKRQKELSKPPATQQNSTPTQPTLPTDPAQHPKGQSQPWPNGYGPPNHPSQPPGSPPPHPNYPDNYTQPPQNHYLPMSDNYPSPNYHQQHPRHFPPNQHYPPTTTPNHTTPPQTKTLTPKASHGKSSAASSVGMKCRKCDLRVERSSVISDTFEGIHRSNIICPTTGVIICSVHERFMSLSLPLNYHGDVPLEEALQQYYRIRAVNWDCPYCSRLHLCHKQMRILFQPKVLILHINRYIEDVRDPKMNRVTFPTDEMTLDEYMTPGWKRRNKEFSLYGICNLQGRGSTSHYTACCRSHSRHHHLKTPWLIFDDEEVQVIDRFKNPREAHILFYRVEEEERK